MDARVDGAPVTPRAGKPVEVNALWVNGLAALAELAEPDRPGRRPGGGARTPAPRSRSARRFPAPAGWLYDVVDAPAPAYPRGGAALHDDDLLRPNQLLAWSLPYAPLAPDAATLAPGRRRRC